MIIALIFTSKKHLIYYYSVSNRLTVADYFLWPDRLDLQLVVLVCFIIPGKKSIFELCYNKITALLLKKYFRKISSYLETLDHWWLWGTRVPTWQIVLTTTKKIGENTPYYFSLFHLQWSKLLLCSPFFLHLFHPKEERVIKRNWSIFSKYTQTSI